MRFRLFFMFVGMISLLSSKCEKEGDDCHHKIQVRNFSPNNIIVAIPVSGFGTAMPNPGNQPKCHLDGQSVSKGNTYDYSPANQCIEDSMNEDERIEIYIVDPNNFNIPDEYYSCDSIQYKNTILEHYSLTLEELKNSDFEIVYR